MSSDYLDNMSTIANEDVEGLKEAHKHYGRSCLKRGGAGLYFMLARKIDRLEQSAEKFGYDIFKAIKEDSRAEGVIDDIRDLRRYLLILEAEARAMQLPAAMTKQRDNVKPEPTRLFPKDASEYIRAAYLELRDGADCWSWEFNSDPYTAVVVYLGQRGIHVTRDHVKRELTFWSYGGEPGKLDSCSVKTETQFDVLNSAATIRTTVEEPTPRPNPPERMVPRRSTNEAERPFGFNPNEDL